MKNFVPAFEVNLAYKTLTLRDIISPSAKAYSDFDEVSNLVYEFKCDCSSNYVGRSSRPFITRIHEHQQPSRAQEKFLKTGARTGIYWHIENCSKYTENKKKFSPSDNSKENFKFFKSHFKILRKGFRSLFEQKRTETFFKRTLRPGLNDQRDHGLFKLF